MHAVEIDSAQPTPDPTMKVNQNLDEAMEDFKKSSVLMKDPKRVKQLVKDLVEGGMDQLQVVADFDYTLSRFHKDGVRCETCHGALSASTLMPKDYQDKAEALFTIYHPIELDTNMPMEDKTPYMEEWWKKSHDVLAMYPMNKSDVETIVRLSNVRLRDGCKSLIETLHQHDIPLLILSAGLGDLLEEVIRQQATLHSNITTISNFMEFDAEGNSCGFHGETIHICNKNVGAKPDCSYFKNQRGRQNALLLGDSLGDLNMAQGVTNIQSILKIGFLNQKIEESLPLYLDGYDVVIVDDQSVDIVNRLLTRIFSQNL